MCQQGETARHWTRDLRPVARGLTRVRQGVSDVARCLANTAESGDGRLSCWRCCRRLRSAVVEWCRGRSCCGWHGLARDPVRRRVCCRLGGFSASPVWRRHGSRGGRGRGGLSLSSANAAPLARRQVVESRHDCSALVLRDSLLLSQRYATSLLNLSTKKSLSRRSFGMTKKLQPRRGKPTAFLNLAW